MNQEREWEQLQTHAAAVARAASAADVFKAFLEVSSIAVPRAAVFLVRKDEIHGWGSFGYPTDVAHLQRGWRGPRDPNWLESLVQERRAWDETGDAPSAGLDFGQPAADESLACPLCIDGKVIAVLVAERTAGESPWVPRALGMLAIVAELRLALGLAERRSLAREPAAARPSGAEAATEAAGPAVTPDALEPARRYARLVATDIRLYNEEAVMLGRRNGDLFDRLAEHLDRGKETFLRRHAALGPVGLEVLHDAYVQVLAAGDRSLIPALD